MIVHQVSQSRFTRGMTPIRPSRPVYGTAARCTCGARFKVNAAPSAGGTKSVKQWTVEHVEAGAAMSVGCFDQHSIKKMILWVLDDGSSAAYVAGLNRIARLDRDMKLTEIDAYNVAGAGLVAAAAGDTATVMAALRMLFDTWPHGQPGLVWPENTNRLQPCGTFHFDGEECGFTDRPCSGSPLG